MKSKVRLPADPGVRGDSEMQGRFYEEGISDKKRRFGDVRAGSRFPSKAPRHDGTNHSEERSSSFSEGLVKVGDEVPT